MDGILEHMNRAFKTFLLWLLMAALPLQGFAAAMPSGCGSARHGLAVTEAHHHGGIAGHGHDGAHHSASDSAAKTNHAPGASHEHQHSSCSACAACCVGATAPPSSSTLTPAYCNSESFVISQVPLVAGFIPAGLERPPKHISA